MVHVMFLGTQAVGQEPRFVIAFGLWWIVDLGNIRVHVKSKLIIHWNAEHTRNWKLEVATNTGVRGEG